MANKVEVFPSLLTLIIYNLEPTCLCAWRCNFQFSPSVVVQSAYNVASTSLLATRSNLQIVIFFINKAAIAVIERTRASVLLCVRRLILQILK